MPITATVTGDKTPMELLAEEVGLPLAYTNDLVKDIAVDVLLSMQTTATPEVKANIQGALKSLYPEGQFLDDGFSPSPPILLGIPGHGKTSVIREGSRMAAQLLGLDFLDNPGSKVPINKKSFVFLSVEFAGQNSALMIRGIPYTMKDDQTEEEYMDYLKERAFANMEHCGGGTIMLDDVANANNAMMNVALPMLAEKRFNRTILKGFYMGATGNLGSLDGTKTNGYSSALLSRGKVVLVRDKVKDLADRLTEKYGNDEFGACFFPSWLIRGGQAMIETIPKPGSFQNVANPRSIDNACQAMRIQLMKVGGPQNGQKALIRHPFDCNVGSLIGKEAADSLISHLNSAYEFADPAARDVILHDKEPAGLEARLKNANAFENVMFFEQFAHALADYTSYRIKNGDEDGQDPKHFEETIRRFSNGLFMLDNAQFTGAVSQMKDRLVYRNPLYSEEQGAGTNGHKRRILTDSAYDRIIAVLKQHPDVDEDRWNDIVQVLSESGLYKDTMSPTQGAAPRARAPAVKKTAAAP